MNFGFMNATLYTPYMKENNIESCMFLDTTLPTCNLCRKKRIENDGAEKQAKIQSEDASGDIMYSVVGWFCSLLKR